MSETTQTPAPPQRRRPLREAAKRWLARHQLPVNFWLHMIGIPLVFAGIGAFFWAPWYWGVLGIVVGYFLQWLGHTLEGNDVGEWAGIKRLLGLPYVAVSPRWAKEEAEETEETGRRHSA